MCNVRYVDKTTKTINTIMKQVFKEGDLLLVFPIPAFEFE